MYRSLALAVTLLALSLAWSIHRHVRTKRVLTELARTDELTGLANRRHILEVAQDEFNRARRYGLPLCVAIIDLDDFKETNDSFGHGAGDLVLAAVDKYLRYHTRNADTFGRLGGDELLAVFPHSSLEAARQVAERLRCGIRELEHPILQLVDRPSPTASIGLAALTEDDTDLDSFLKRADRAVSVAKRSGRDCVLFAGE